MSPSSSSAAPYFPLLGEPLSLDLLNTRIRKDGAVVDLLDRPIPRNYLPIPKGRRLSQ